MELSRAIASIAVVLGVILAAGYAQGESAAGATKQTAQDKVQAREAERRAAVLEQEKRKDAFERACNKPLRTDTDRDLCRTAYKRLQLVK
ncbi:MAG TPA: hypothetical protein VGX52_06360 [Burkholderiales bacterium]|nr:hypothetical protein [Burkholderiales bacterium]